MAQALNLTVDDALTPSKQAGTQQRISDAAQSLYNSAKPRQQALPTGGSGGGGLYDAGTQAGTSLYDIGKRVSSQEQTKKSIESDDGYDTNFMDYVQSAVAGSHELVAAVGGFSNWLGGLVNDDGELNTAQEWGRELRDHHRGLSQDRLDKMSDDAKALMNREFLDKDESAMYSLRSILLKLANTAPSMAATIGPVGLAARGGAGLATLAKMGAKARGRTIAAAAGVAGAGTETVLATGFTANDIAEYVDNLSPAELQATPGYKAMKAENLSDTEIRDAVLADAVSTAGAFAAATSAVTGGVGGALLGKVFQNAGRSRLQRARTAALTEGMQEALQESGETLSGNIAKQQHVNTEQSLTEGMAESAVAGGVLGGLMGGGVGAVAGPPPIPASAPGEPETITPVSDLPPKQGEQPPMAGQPPPHVPPAPDAAPAQTEGVAPPPGPAPTEAVAQPSPDAQGNATAERPEDIAAQLREVGDKDSPKNAMYISPENLQTEEQRQAVYKYLHDNYEERADAGLDPLLPHEDQHGGIFVTSDPDAYQYYKEGVKLNNPGRSDKARKFGLKQKYEAEDGGLLGKLLGYEQTKEEAGVTELGDDAVVVTVLDSDGSVVEEQAVSPDKAEEVRAKRQKTYPETYSVQVETPEAAQARRATPATIDTLVEDGELGRILEEIEPSGGAIPTTGAPAATGTQNIHKPKAPVIPIKPTSQGSATTTQAAPKKVLTKKQRAEKRTKDIETGVGALRKQIKDPKTVGFMKELLTGVRGSIQNSQAGKRTEWEQQLTVLEQALDRGEMDNFAEKFYHFVAKGVGKDAPARLKGKREQFFDDVGSGSDLNRSIQALTSLMPKGQAGVTYKQRRQEIEDKHVADEYIKEMEKKLPNTAAARRFIDEWQKLIKDPGKNKDGSTRKKVAGEEHATYAAPIKAFIDREFNRLANAGNLTDAQMSDIKAKLEPFKKIGGKQFVNVPTYKEAAPVFAEVNEILDGAQSQKPAEKTDSEQTEEVSEPPPEQPAEPEAQPEVEQPPEQPAEPTEAPAEPSPPKPAKKPTVVVKPPKKPKRKAPPAPKKDTPKLIKVIGPGKSTGKPAAEFEANTKKGYLVDFTGTDDFKQGFIWRENGAKEFILSIKLGVGSIRHLRTGHGKRGVLLDALRKNGIQPVLDYHAKTVQEEVTVKSDGNITDIPADFDVENLSEHPMFELLDAHDPVLANEFRHAFMAAMRADSDIAYGQEMDALADAAALIDQDINDWSPLVEASRKQFLERRNKTERDNPIEAHAPELDLEAAGFEEGLTFEVDSGARAAIKKEDQHKKLVGLLEKDYGREGAQQVLSDIDRRVEAERKVLENLKRDKLADGDKTVKQDAKNSIDQAVKQFRADQYELLLDQLSKTSDFTVEEEQGDFLSEDQRAEREELEASEVDVADYGDFDEFQDDYTSRMGIGTYNRHPATRKLMTARADLDAEQALALHNLPIKTTMGYEKLLGQGVEKLNPAIKAIFDRLMDSGLDIPVVFNHELVRAGVAGAAHQPTFLDGPKKGRPDPRLAVIELNPTLIGDKLVHTLLHEWVHVATIAGMESDVELRTAIKGLWKRAKRASKTPDAYGFTDEREFVAEALTNTGFQAELMGIKLDNIYTQQEMGTVRRKLHDAWEWFVHIVGKYFGIVSKPQETAMHYAMALGNTSILTRKDIDALYGKETPRGKIATSFHLVPRTKGEAIELKTRGREMSSRGGLRFHSMDQLYRRYRSKFRAAGSKAYDEYMRRWREKQGIVSDERRKGDKIVRDWFNLERHSPDDAQAMADLMVDSTMAKFDPRENVDLSTTVPKQEQQQALKDRFDSLGTNAQTMFSNVAAFHKNQRREVQEYGIEALLLKSGFPKTQHLSRVAKRLANIPTRDKVHVAAGLRAASFGQMDPKDVSILADDIVNLKQLSDVEGIYFMLRRTGEYAVKGKRQTILQAPDEGTAAEWRDRIRAGQAAGGREFQPHSKAKVVENNGGFAVDIYEEVYELHDTLAEAEAASKALKSALVGGEVSSAITKRKQEQPHLTGAMSKLASRIKKNINTGPGSAKGAFDEHIESAVIQLLAEDATRMSELRRRNIEGANSKDMRKFFAERVMANAWSIADMKTAPYMEEAYKEMTTQADSHSDPKMARELGRVTNHLHEREMQNFAFREEDPLTENLSRLGYLMALASPAYSMINATQMALVTYPVLAAKHGPAKAMAVMMKNIKQSLGQDFRAEVKNTRGGLKALPADYADNMAETWGITETDPEKKKLRLDINNVKSKGDMLKALIDVNAVDSSFIQSLYESINAAGGNDPLTRARDATMTWTKAWPQMVEQFNRIATAGAVWDLETGSGASPVEAAKAAQEAILKTHGDYSDANKPKFFKDFGNWGKVILMFKTYTQFISALYVENIAAAAFGKGEVKRSEAAKVLGYITLTHTAAAGVLGAAPTQVLAPLMMLLNAMLGDDDDPLTLEDAIEHAALDLTGDKKWAEVLTRGLPRAVGIDLHNRVGLNGMFMLPPGDYLDEKGKAQHYLLQILGPMAGYFVNALEGAQHIANGDVAKGVERAAPKLVKDFLKAYRYNEEGVVDKSGVPMLPPDQMGLRHSAIQAFGLAPTKTARMYETAGAVMRYEGRLEKRASKLKNDWYNADTAEERREAVRAIQKFNRSRPGNYAIKVSSLRRGVVTRKEKEIKRDRGMYWRDPNTRRNLEWATE